MAETHAEKPLTEQKPLLLLAAELQDVLSHTGHDEMYGVKLVAPTNDTPASIPTLNILQKFLRANAGDVNAARLQLTEALTWRKEYKPLEVRDEVFEASKFGGLGYVTTIKGVKATKNAQDIATFNIYGAAAKDVKNTFGDADRFVRWRVALMELTLAQLHLESADQLIPEYGQGPDPYQAIQIHDYLSVSFFRQPAEIKAASSKVIHTFQRNYPETVSYKYFINVPLIMQWMMGAIKAFLSKDSIQKMTWLTYGNQLHSYISDDVPTVYGGTGAPLEETGMTTKYDHVYGAVSDAPVATSTEPTATQHSVQPTEEQAATSA